MLDKILEELVRKGNKKQERHFQTNVRALNATLPVLATAGAALLTARGDGLEPFEGVFEAVGGVALTPIFSARAQPRSALVELSRRIKAEPQP